jgi:hypothetical protein
VLFNSFAAVKYASWGQPEGQRSFLWTAAHMWRRRVALWCCGLDDFRGGRRREPGMRAPPSPALTQQGRAARRPGGRASRAREDRPSPWGSVLARASAPRPWPRAARRCRTPILSTIIRSVSRTPKDS